MTIMQGRTRQGIKAVRLVLGAWLGSSGLVVAAQAPAPVPSPAPAPTVSSPAAAPAPGVATLTPAAAGSPAFAPDQQLVRFTTPPGVQVEVLGPPAEAYASVPGDPQSTFAMRVGTGYRLRVSNLPDRPGQELYPVIEVVGHLHRPQGIDPLKYPIRVMLDAADIDDVLDRGRMITHVVYLEDPEQAIPLHLPKDEIPVVPLSPVEDPLRVAKGLGRVVAIVRIGNRVPSPEETASGSPLLGPVGGPCPFVTPEGGRCGLPCGPVEGTPPPAGRPWLPRDEYLCDGGDHGMNVHFSGEGGLQGIDPRDAVVQFRDDRRARVLPTNTVCVYAPRFAALRSALGANETETVQVLKGADQVQRQAIQTVRQNPLRMTQNQSPELNRGRSRPSGVISRVGVQNHTELRVLDGVDLIQHVAGHAYDVGPQTEQLKRMPAQFRLRDQAQGIQTGESAIVTGIVEGAGENVMAWKPQEVASVEEPPNKPGMAVVKQVSAAEAQPGDSLTYTISYRNMGNVPIKSVSIIDSLLPRLEYVPGSAQGPKGTVFTASDNRVGATELRWDIGTVPPGVTGAVSFQVKVR